MAQQNSMPAHILAGHRAADQDHIGWTLNLLSDLARKHGDVATFADRMLEIGPQVAAGDGDFLAAYERAIRVDLPRAFYAGHVRGNPRQLVSDLTALLAGGERRRTLAHLMPRDALAELAEQAAARANSVTR